MATNNSDLISIVPEQHAELLAQKLLDGQLVLFVGAGLSHLAIAKDGSGRRLPLWNELMEQVASSCHEDAEAFDGNPLDLFDAVAYAQDRFTLEEAVRKQIDDHAYKLSSAHFALAKLPWNSVFTTNYDSLLQRLLDEKPVFEEQDYERIALPESERPQLFQIHGTLHRPHTLTREDYRLWPEKHPRAYRHLEHLVFEKTILFVGYSLSDPHLDSLLAMVRKITKDREKRLYAWFWHLPEAKARLLDRRDKIEAISLEKEFDWTSSFEQLGVALKRLQDAKVSDLSTVANLDVYAYDREQYFSGLNARYGVANLQGLYQWGAGYTRDDVLLSEVFVEPDLELDETITNSEQNYLNKTKQTGSLHHAQMARDFDSESGFNSRRQAAMAIFLDTARLVVVGDPGQGKSTLLRSVLLHQISLWKNQPQSHPLPVYIRLADWESLPGQTEGKLLACIKELLPRLGEVGSNAVKHWLEGPILWLLDGIDEIRDPHERLRFHEELISTSQLRATDRWVVATRPSGEPGRGFTDDWIRTKLPSLSNHQIKQVLVGWGKVLERKEGLIINAQRMSNALKENRGLRGIRGNALLLTLAVLFYKSRGRLPNDRWEFYDAAEQAVRDAWVRYRIRDADRYLPGDYLPELLGQLALKGMENGQVIFMRQDLENNARIILKERGYTGREQDEEISRFLRAAEDLIGVLVEQGPERYGFLHLTFQEFYAAKALINRSGDVAQYISQYWDHPDWSEVWVLYALKIQNDSSRFAELFQNILASADPLDQFLHREKITCLVLAGTGGVSLPEVAIKVLKWAANLLSQKKNDPLFLVFDVLAQWERSLPQYLIDALLICLNSDSTEIRRAAVQALGMATENPVVLNALLKSLKDEKGRVRSVSVLALRNKADDSTVLEAILASQSDPDTRVRDACVQVLREIVHKISVRDALLKLLTENNKRTCVVTIQVLSVLTDDPLVKDTLLVALTDSDSYVVCAAIEALTQACNESIIRNAILEHLEDSDSKVRYATVKALSSSSGEVIVRNALLTKLGDEDAGVRHAVINALAMFVDQIDIGNAIRLCLKDENSDVRLAAIAACSKQVRDPKVRDALLISLVDENRQVRQKVTQVLTVIEGQPLVRDLLMAFQTISSDLQSSEAKNAIISGINNPSVQTLLLDCLEHQNSEFRTIAIKILSDSLNHIEICDALMQRLNHKSSYVRSAAVTSLAKGLDQTVVREALLRKLTDKNWYVRSKTIAILEKIINQPEVFTAIFSQLADPVYSVRCAVIKALATVLEHKQMPDTFISCLSDENASVRCAAVEALSNFIHQSKVRDEILVCLDDKNGDVRIASINACSSIVEQVAVKNAVLNSLTDKSGYIRSVVIKALSTVCKEPEVMDALLTCLDDKNHRAKINAINVLGQIKSNPLVEEALAKIHLKSSYEELQEQSCESNVKTFYSEDDEARKMNKNSETLRRRPSSEIVSDRVLLKAHYTRLKDDSPNVRKAAIVALSTMANQSDVREELILKLEDKRVGSAAAETLARYILIEKFGIKP